MKTLWHTCVVLLFFFGIALAGTEITVPYPSDIMNKNNTHLQIIDQDTRECPSGPTLVTRLVYETETETRLFLSFLIPDPQNSRKVEVLLEITSESRDFKQAWIDKTGTNVADEYFSNIDDLIVHYYSPCDVVSSRLNK